MDNDRISELQQENDRLRYLADHDELTGVLSRRAAEKQIRERLTAGGCLLVCDLDEFKKVNDRYGHLCGDRYLREAARLLASLLAPDDLLGRIGGDEFVIFSREKPAEDRMRELICRIGERFPGGREEKETVIGISAGGAVSRPDDTYETLFARADREMLVVKNSRHERREPAGEPDRINRKGITGDLMKEETQAFVQRFHQLRMEKGISARKMSLELGQSAAYVNRIENGVMLPSMDAFFDICGYFGITPKDFFSYEKEISPDLQQAMQALKAMPEEQRGHMLALIQDM